MPDQFLIHLPGGMEFSVVLFLLLALLGGPIVLGIWLIIRRRRTKKK